MKTPLILFAALLLYGISWLSAAPPQDDIPKADSPARKGTAKPASTPFATKGKQELNVRYKKTPERELCLDLFYPADRPLKNLPTIIYTHGGGWAAGNKAGVSKGAHGRAFLMLVEAGFCVVSVDYRLYHKDGHIFMRDCVIDSKDAVRYLAKNSETLGLDPTRFFVIGDSAGGQIAQILLLSSPESLPGDPELAGATYQVKAGVSWYGPCDFEKTDLFNHDDQPDFKDRFAARILKPDSDAKDKLKLYREMSPIQYLTKDSPPLLMIQGDKDTTIPVKHAYYMQEKAAAVHAPVEIMIIKNAGHNWREVGSPIEPSADEIVQKTVRFFTEHLDAEKPAANSKRAADVLPPFSWDHVPVYAHVGKASDDFTAEELEFLAKHFNFITIEKDQATRKHRSTEAGFAIAAKEIKQRNANAKVLFYWNASLDTSTGRGDYLAKKTFPRDGFLKNNQGDPVLRRKTVPNYDLERQDVRAWWSDVAAKAVSDYGADGIFADAMGQNIEKGLDEKKIAALWLRGLRCSKRRGARLAPTS